MRLSSRRSSSSELTSSTGKKAHERQRRVLAPALKYVKPDFNEKYFFDATSFSPQSVKKLTDIFFEKSVYLANQWNKILELEDGQKEAEIEITNWAGRFAYVFSSRYSLPLPLMSSSFSLDTVGRAAFSYDFGCLSGEPHALASALDGLTNNEHRRSSFYMKALFWIFPSILSIGKKGESIREVKHELGAIASKMWRESKLVEDKDSRTLMANIREL